MRTATATHTASVRDRERLSTELRALISRPLAEIRVTRVRWPDGLRWVVMALAVDCKACWGRREVPLPSGGLHHDIAILIRDAFPHANWAVAQDYDVATGVLREHSVRLPACLRGDDL